jgi:hypothetical protein
MSFFLPTVYALIIHDSDHKLHGSSVGKYLK